MMSVEFTKCKRTGLPWIYLAGGLAGAALPVLNTAVRTGMFLEKAERISPVQVLMEANWQMVSMVNLLLIVLGSTVLYHMEYADNAIQRMDVMPVKPMKIFVNKFLMLTGFVLLAVVLETAGILVCLYGWFLPGEGFLMETGRNIGFGILLLLPVTVLMLAVSSVCRNMWITLGIGVIGIFFANIMMNGSFWVSLIPFSMPFRLLSGMDGKDVIRFLSAAAGETVLFLAVAGLLQNRRRNAS